MRIIAGTSHGTKLETLEGDEITRPTAERVKEGIFSSVQFMLEQARVLDLFAGSGQLGIEALSRGAEKCVFIDESRDACEVVRRNLKAAGFFKNAVVAQTAAQSYLAACKEQFDLVLLDPPYHHDTVQAVLPLIERVTAKNGTVIAETEYGVDMPHSVGALKLKKQYKYGTIAVARYVKESD